MRARAFLCVPYHVPNTRGNILYHARGSSLWTYRSHVRSNEQVITVRTEESTGPSTLLDLQRDQESTAKLLSCGIVHEGVSILHSTNSVPQAGFSSYDKNETNTTPECANAH